MNQKPPPQRILVRYVSGHRAALSSGWHPYGDRRPLPAHLAQLLAATLRQQGAEVRLEDA